MRMRMVLQLLSLVLVLVAGATVAAVAHDGEHGHAALASGADVAWGPAPPGLPPGSKAAVIHGNPAAEGPFTLRAWLPDGYKVKPHWHPTAEYLTVLSGTLHAGMGETWDAAKATKLSAGGFVAMDAQMRHWVWSEGETVIQVHGTGPFAITYVNPADDPRQPAK